MFGISFLELIVIGVLILVVLGPEKLPEVAGWVGKGMRELRRASNLMRDTLMIDDEPDFARDRQRRARQLELAKKKRELEAEAEAGTSSKTEGMALDQLDDQDFPDSLDEALTKHYNLEPVREVRVATAGPTDDGAREVELPVRESATSLRSVSLVPETQEDIAS